MCFHFLKCREKPEGNWLMLVQHLQSVLWYTDVFIEQPYQKLIEREIYSFKHGQFASLQPSFQWRDAAFTETLFPSGSCLLCWILCWAGQNLTRTKIPLLSLKNKVLMVWAGWKWFYSSETIMTKHLLGLKPYSLKLLKQRFTSQVDVYGAVSFEAVRLFSCELLNWKCKMHIMMNVTIETVFLDVLKQNPL